MREIIAGALPWQGPSYPSPEAAVAAAKQHHKVTRLGEEPIISQVLSHEAEVRLRLDDGHVIDILCLEDGTVDYAICPAQALGFQNADDIEDRAVIRLPDLIYTWDRRRLIEGLEGRRLKAIVSRLKDLLLYVDDLEPIQFCALLNAETRRPFLFWAPAN